MMSFHQQKIFTKISKLNRGGILNRRCNNNCHKYFDDSRLATIGRNVTVADAFLRCGLFARIIYSLIQLNY